MKKKPYAILAALMGLTVSSISWAQPIKADLGNVGGGTKILTISGDAAREIYLGLDAKEADVKDDGTLLIKVGPSIACEIDMSKITEQRYSCRVQIWKTGEIVPGIGSPYLIPKPSSCND